MNTGTWFSLRKWRSCSPRTASSPRTSGGRSGCSRAGGGCTTRFTGRSLTSCSSGGPSITSSSSRRTRPPPPRCSKSEHQVLRFYISLSRLASSPLFPSPPPFSYALALLVFVEMLISETDC